MSETLQASQAPNWSQWVTNFDGAYSDFYAAYNQLMQIGPDIQQNDPASVPAYNDLLQRASDIAYQLEQWKATRDYVAHWLQTVLSAQGAGYYEANAPSGFSGLGASIFSAAYTVAQGLAAAIGFIVVVQQIIDSIKFMIQRTTAIMTAKAQGASTEDAVALADAQFGKITSFSGGLGNAFGWAVLAGLLLWFGPSIIHAVTGPKRNH